MQKVLMTSISIDELKILIVDSVNACLKHDPALKSLRKNATGKEQLYTATEARDLLKISRTTEHELNKKGVLTPVMVGGRKRYTKEAIEAVVVEI